MASSSTTRNVQALLEGLSKLKQQKESVLLSNKKKVEEYNKVRHDMEMLPKNLSYDTMIPFGRCAFMPGKIVNTNQVLVLLGDNTFVECSTHRATQIIDRRIQYIQDAVKTLESDIEACKTQLEVFGQVQKDQTFEIKENFDFDEEEKWRADHREKVSREKRAETEKERAERPSEEEFQQLMDRLDELEVEEKLETRTAMDRDETKKRIRWAQDEYSSKDSVAKKIVNEDAEFNCKPSSILKKRNGTEEDRDLLETRQDPSLSRKTVVVPGPEHAFTGTISEHASEASVSSFPTDNTKSANNKPVSKFKQRKTKGS